jgi:hypothetical protein
MSVGSHSGCAGRLTANRCGRRSQQTAGSILVLLLWRYYSAQIFLYGAEFTWVYVTQRRPQTGT